MHLARRRHGLPARRHLDDPVAQRREADATGPGGLRQQAVARQPRQGVGLQAPGIPGPIDDEVHAGEVTEAEKAVDLEGLGLEDLGQLCGDVRREDLLGHPRLVFALVVEELVLGDDLTHRKGPITEDPDGELPDSAIPAWYLHS